MSTERRVSQMPLKNLWRATGESFGERRGYLEKREVVSRLTDGAVCFAVADVGNPLVWKSLSYATASQTGEIKTLMNQVVEDPAQPIHLEDYPNEAAMVASLWFDGSDREIVLLEVHH